MTATKHIGILLSGRGSNFQALADSVDAGRLPGARIALVVSNREGAPGIDLAAARKIPTAAPIVAQAIVPIEPGDTPDTLAVRVLAEEHRIYTEAVRLILSGQYRIEGRRVLPAATQGTAR